MRILFGVTQRVVKLFYVNSIGTFEEILTIYFAIYIQRPFLQGVPKKPPPINKNSCSTCFRYTFVKTNSNKKPDKV